MIMKTKRNVFAVTALLLTISGASAADSIDTTFGQIVSDQGTITLPGNVRDSWVHLGSWVVDNADAPGHGFHDVYTQPQAARAYRQTGQFIDGTVLVKEIRTLGSGQLTTGPAKWARDPAVWFVMVRDHKQRHAGKHWQEGWGWALFKAPDQASNVSEGFDASCRGCHLPAREDDWVFIEGYPTLRPE